jgi:SPP1 gp7 family putative phage head morphogenesis protein
LTTAPQLYRTAADALDEMLTGVLRVPVAKAINPQTKAGFVTIQNRLSRAMLAAAGKDPTLAMRRALDALDVDWPNLTSAQRDAVYRSATAALAKYHASMVPRVTNVLVKEAPNVAGLVRSSAIRLYDLPLSFSLSTQDRRLVDFLARSNVAFVTDTYGRYRQRFSARARQIVAAGLEQGLGRDEIASDLDSAFADTGIVRDRAYFQVVAGAFVGRARSNGNLNAFSEAGITKYRVVAVLDEVTSEICRFMHGREFDVSKATAQFAATAAMTDPAQIKATMPWSSVGTDDDGNSVIYYRNINGDRKTVARVDEFGEGERDRIGTYSKALNETKLAAAGILTPPYHGSCRTAIVAVV